MKIETKPVQSSNIAEIGYDAEEQVLRVVFKNNSVYDYANVEEGRYKSMMGAHSVGCYFSSFIKNVYGYERIR